MTRTLLLTTLALAATIPTPPPCGAQTRSGAAATRNPGAAQVVLGPGDQVRITVWRKPELTGDFTIAADGSITHPLYRVIQVGGLPLATAEARLRSFLEQYEAHPQFVLEPLFRVTVGGEVARPSLYMLRPENSVAQALALAGGPTERGRRDRVRLLRGDGETSLDVAEQAQMPIHSGDQLFVERRRSFLRDYMVPVIVLAGSVSAIINAVQTAR